MTLTRTQASSLEVSPANQDISKANGSNVGGAGDPTGGHSMKHRESGANSGGSRALKQAGRKQKGSGGEGGS